jgi:uncharacterized protein DUF3367
LWDPQSAFGQLQSQAYGYLLPMGPFHWLLDALSVPDWVTQRLGWSVVLCVAFLGVWKLCNALDCGVPWTRFAAALLYALSPQMLGEVSLASIEVWPMAMAPWVLLPLVIPRARSGWWRVGWSAVAFGLVGGVNAVATGATLVLPALWLLTRRLDRTTLKVAVGWLGCVLVVSVWWLVPLMLVVRYGDAPLAVAHNLDLIVGLPLALAAAHVLSKVTVLATVRGLHRRMVPVLAVCMIVTLAIPAVFSQLPRREGYDAIPEHWREAATWLDRQTASGSVLVVPAASSTDFIWGSTSDEPFQALLKRPMVARDAAPLGSAETTRWLDEVERRLGSGVGDTTLQQALSHAGVRFVVVRNDLRYDAQVTPTLAVHESLAESGIKRVAYFGPSDGSSIEQPGVTVDGHTRLPYPSVEIYDVGGTSPARLIPQSRLVEVRGAAEDVPAALTALGGDREAVTTSDAAGRLSGLPLIQTDGAQLRGTSIDRPADDHPPVLIAAGAGRQDRRTVPSEDRQPSALVLRNQQIGRSACLHIGTRPLCRQADAKDSEEPTGLLRSVELPQAASYQLHGTALPADGPKLESLLTVPGAITASATSRAVTAPEGRPGAAVDRDQSTGWVANPADPHPALTLKLPEARKISGLQFLSGPYLTASRPAGVSIRFDGGPAARSTVDPDGYVRFAERTARTIELAFTSTKPMVDVDSATGDAQTAPVGVSEVRVLGADDLRKALDPNRQTGAYCGNGPAVRVDGVLVDTQVKATMLDLLQRHPVTFTTCGAGSAVPLRAGRHDVDVLAGGGVVPVEATLTKAGFGNVSVTPVQGAEVWRPNPAELTVEVPAADEQSVLTVAQNYNKGWEAYDGSGRKLTPIRVAGWQQGWILPAGAEQVVTARFVPDRTYRASLLVGLLGLLTAIAMAVFYRRRHSAHRLRKGRWVLASR